MNTVTADIAGLPANATRMLTVEILLANSGHSVRTCWKDVLESCLYILRGKLRGTT